MLCEIGRLRSIGRVKALRKVRATPTRSTGPRRHVTFEVLSGLVQQTLKSALGETSEAIRPHVGWLNDGRKKSSDFAASPLNQSREFQSIVAGLREGVAPEGWPETARLYNFVFIGGLWSHLYPLSYLKSLKGLLKRGIITHRISSFDTRLATDLTGRSVAAELQKCVNEHPARKMIIFGHSKGSLDALEALRLEPSLVPHVHRIVSLQSPFGGSPYAGAFLRSNNYVKTIIDKAVIQWLAGDYSGIQCLTYEARQEWFRKNPLESVSTPLLCFASTAMPEGLLFEDLSTYMRNTFGLDNDGLVAVSDAILPGSPFVLAHGVSHLAPVFNDDVNNLTLPSLAIEALAYMATRTHAPQGETPLIL